MTRRLMPYTQQELDEQWVKITQGEGKGPYKESFPLIPKADVRTPEVTSESDTAPHDNDTNCHASVGVATMLDALTQALDEDMEQGASWMNEAAHAEFKRKYPRFVTLLAYARNIDWSKE